MAAPCWKNGKPYDEDIYMQSLRRRGYLLAGVLGTPTGEGWKSVAGFKNYLKTILDGLAQKTPLLQRSLVPAGRSAIPTHSTSS